jgi:hypothetical protein
METPTDKWYEIRRFCSLIGAFAGIYSCYNPQWLYLSAAYLTLFMIVDYPYAKEDMKIHHAISVVLFFVYGYGFMSSDVVAFLFPPLFHNEYSTVFLSGIPLILNHLPNGLKPLEPVIKYSGFAAFTYTFYRYRLIEYSWYLIFNPDFYQIQVHWFGKTIIMICSFGFYILNLYWACLIQHKIYKIINDLNPRWIKE